MGSVYRLSIFLCLLLPLYSSAADSIGQYCDKRFDNTQRQTNINRVLTNLVAGATVGGFANTTYGEGNNTVFGLVQCRGDVSAADCSACITDAAAKLSAACRNQADGRIWYDYCFMRYDTEEFIGVADTGYSLILINVENATDPVAFDKKVGKLMTRVSALAVIPGAGGLGRGEAMFSPDVTIYGLAMCTRDLEPLACANCLASAVEKFPDYCRYRKGCRVLYSSCQARYEIYPFFFPI